MMRKKACVFGEIRQNNSTAKHLHYSVNEHWAVFLLGEWRTKRLQLASPLAREQILASKGPGESTLSDMNSLFEMGQLRNSWPGHSEVQNSTNHISFGEHSSKRQIAQEYRNLNWRQTYRMWWTMVNRWASAFMWCNIFESHTQKTERFARLRAIMTQ